MRKLIYAFAICGLFAAIAANSATNSPSCITQVVGPDGVVCPGNGIKSHLGQKGGTVSPGASNPTPANGQSHSTTPWMGNTTATIAQQMPVVLLYEAQTQPANTAQQMINMGPYMFAAFTNDYIRNGGNVAGFLNSLAKGATAAQMVYVRTGFGAVTDTAVNSYAPASVSSTYRASTKAASLATSHSQLIDKGLVNANGLGGFFPATFSMTQNELWWMYFAEGTGTTIAQATAKMIFFEASVLQTTFVVSYKAGGYIVSFLDLVDPNINIEIGNIIGATVDMAINVASSVSGTGYIDLPLDSEGNYIFPDANVDLPFWDYDWEDCVYLGC